MFSPGTKITPLPSDDWDPPLESHPFPVRFKSDDLGGGLRGLSDISSIKIVPGSKTIRGIRWGEVIEVIKMIEDPQGTENPMCLVQTETGQGYVWADMFGIAPSTSEERKERISKTLAKAGYKRLT